MPAKSAASSGRTRVFVFPTKLDDAYERGHVWLWNSSGSRASGSGLCKIEVSIFGMLGTSSTGGHFIHTRHRVPEKRVLSASGYLNTDLSPWFGSSVPTRAVSSP